MKKIAKKLLVVLIFSFLTSSIFAQNTAGEGVERFALYVASNLGGEGRATLRYAGSDAEKLSATMIELGGVKKQNSFVLVDSTKDEIDGAFNNISAIINSKSSSAKRVEFLFYYSGHSDEDALLLGEEKYDYSALKAKISSIPSDVHVVMLDSCFSGNFLRAKGGTRTASFLVDDSSVVQGHAYLSSSSETESSQESDTIGASYFTQSLVTGLRGAADTSGDNRVSLNELYYYAFNDTLKQTELSKIGTQHPAYDITLVGSGDLVLTDVSTADSMLVLPAEMTGRFLIRTVEGKLVSEINKVSGMYMSLALPVGFYSVTVINENSTTQAAVKLDKNSAYTLEPNTLRQVPLTQGVARGPGSTDSTYPSNGVVNNYNVTVNGGDVTFNGVAENYGTAVTGREYTYTGDGSEFDYIGSYTVPSNYSSYSDTEAGSWQAYEDTFESSFDIGNLDFAPFVFSVFPGVSFPFAKNTIFALSPFMSTFDNVRGMQISGFSSHVSNTLEGLQISGLTNSVGGNFKGLQVSGFINTIWGEGQGIQSAPFMNITHKDFRGIQISSFMNIAKNVKGMQFSPFMNIAKNVTGSQVGLINIADTNTGVSFGLFNFISNGICEVGIYKDRNKQYAIQYRGGTSTFFTSFILEGIVENKDPAEAFVGGFGVGTRFGEGFFTIDLEFITRAYLTGALVAKGNEFVNEVDRLERTGSDDKTKLKQIVTSFDEYIIPCARITLDLNIGKNFGLFWAYNIDAKQGFTQMIKNQGITFKNAKNFVNAYWTFGLKF